MIFIISTSGNNKINMLVAFGLYSNSNLQINQYNNLLIIILKLIYQKNLITNYLVIYYENIKTLNFNIFGNILVDTF